MLSLVTLSYMKLRYVNYYFILRKFFTWSKVFRFLYSELISLCFSLNLLT